MLLLTYCFVIFHIDLKEIYKPGVETVLVNGPPIGQQTFSSNLICQRMPPVPASS